MTECSKMQMHGQKNCTGTMYYYEPLRVNKVQSCPFKGIAL